MTLISVNENGGGGSGKAVYIDRVRGFKGRWPGLT